MLALLLKKDTLQLFVVRMRIDPRAPIITLETKLVGEKGSCIVEAALDTGSTYSIAPRRILRKLGYTLRTAREKAHITTASGTEIVPVFVVKTIESAGLRKKNIKVACHDLPPQATVSVLLGLNFLRDAVTKLDLKRGVLELNDP